MKSVADIAAEAEKKFQLTATLQTACLDLIGTSWQAAELAEQIAHCIQRPGSELHAWSRLIVGYGGEPDNPRAIAAGYKEMEGRK